MFISPLHTIIIEYIHFPQRTSGQIHRFWDSLEKMKSSSEDLFVVRDDHVNHVDHSPGADRTYSLREIFLPYLELTFPDLREEFDALYANWHWIGHGDVLRILGNIDMRDMEVNEFIQPFFPCLERVSNVGLISNLTLHVHFLNLRKAIIHCTGLIEVTDDYPSPERVSVVSTNSRALWFESPEGYIANGHCLRDPKNVGTIHIPYTRELKFLLPWIFNRDRIIKRTMLEQIL